MSGIRLRPYAGVRDLVRMQAVLSEQFADGGAWHPGDLAWSVRHGSHLEASTLCTVAQDGDGAVLGWAWLYRYGWLVVSPEDAGLGVRAPLLRAALDTAAHLSAHGDTLDRGLLVECAEDDGEFAALLREEGFRRDPAREGQVTRRSLDGLAAPVLPDGFTVRGVDDALVAERVEAHRAAFAPSALEISGYRRLRQTPPYRADLDRAVLAPDGRVAAFCIAWHDPQSGWGLLEPVGTRPEFQRRGLATAVCLDALHQLRAAGAHGAQVGCESGSAGCATYHSIGFATVRRLHLYRREA
jgi:GNAT superfamily N-acetyltransferase